MNSVGFACYTMQRSRLPSRRFCTVLEKTAGICKCSASRTTSFDQSICWNNSHGFLAGSPKRQRLRCFPVPVAASLLAFSICPQTMSVPASNHVSNSLLLERQIQTAAEVPLVVAGGFGDCGIGESPGLRGFFIFSVNGNWYSSGSSSSGNFHAM